MEVEGKLIKKLDVRSGVSASGNSWSSQDFVIEIPGQYPQLAVFNVYGDRVQLSQFNDGEYIKVSFDIRGREYQGKYYNTLNCWKIERPGVDGQNGGSQPGGTTAPQGGTTTVQPPQPSAPVEQPQSLQVLKGKGVSLATRHPLIK